jgi:hypothetical protein
MSVEIPLTRGFVAVVDGDDADRVTAAGPWCAAPNGRNVYAHRRIVRDGKATTQGMHAFLTGFARCDHVNGDGLDNRRANLREATHGQNMANRRPQGPSYKGITRRSDGRWQAQIQAARVHRHLGYFATPEAAAAAYDAAAVELFGEFARLNFPRSAA